MKIRSGIGRLVCGVGLPLLFLTALVAKEPAGSNKTNYSIGFPADLLSAVDIDLDGDVDLVATSSTSRLRTVLFNNGSGAFEIRGAAVQRVAVQGDGRISVTGDFDADGELDLAVADALSDTIRVQVSRSRSRSGDCPSIVSAPTHQSVRDGDSAVFRVSLNGAPTVRYQWRKNGATLEDDGRVRGTTTNELILDGVMAEDAGLYDVVVQNGCGDATSPPGSLTLAPLGGALNEWTSLSGGSFQTGGNWSSGVAPGTGETAFFDLSGQYSVTLGGNASSNRLIVADDNVSFNLGGLSYSLTETNPGLPGILVGQSAGDAGTLTVGSGSMNAVNVTLGATAGSSGNWAVKSGAVVDVVGRIIVGAAAPGDLSVTGGGHLDAGSALIGRPGGSGTALVSGPGSRLAISGSIRVGDGGPATLDVTSGGAVTSSASTVGGNTNAIVTLDGPGASWSAGSLGMAGFGDGTIIVQGGATLTTANAELGFGLDSIATIRVTGSGSRWDSGPTVVGGNAEGRVEIFSGGKVTTTGNALIGRETGGTVDVRGAGSSWTHNNSIQLGLDDNGSILASAGGQVSAVSIEIGNLRRKLSELDVRGNGSLVAVSGAVHVGFIPGLAGDPFTAVVANGGRLTVGNELKLSSGSIDTSTGGITVGGGTAAQNGELRVNAGGRFRVVGSLGTVTANQLNASGGQIIGSGRITAPVSNAGIVSPGSSIGSMTVGQYSQLAGGALEIEVASLPNHDQLVVEGAAQLDGTLRVQNTGAYVPANGDSLVVLSAASTTGTFSNVELNGFDTLTTADVTYSPTAVSLTFNACVMQTWFRDADGDSIGDSQAAVSACNRPEGFVAPAADCDDSNRSVWRRPGEVESVSFSDALTLAWNMPAAMGGTSVDMYVLRADDAQGFATSICVNPDDATPTHAVDLDVPAPNGVFMYLVRAENACPSPSGLGTLGRASSGAIRNGHTCP